MGAMKEAIGVWTILGFLASTSLGWGQSSSGQAADFTAQVNLRVYNRAGVPEAELAQAMSIMADVFAKAGISIAWADCSKGSEAGALRSGCTGNLSEAHFVVQVLPKLSRPYPGLSTFTLGLTVLDGQGNGTYATVLYDRVEELAARTDCRREVLLAYATAHEVGHLLLGSNTHAPFGIMAPRWERHALGLAEKRRLHFSRVETQQLRARLQALVAPTAAQY
jgi:hypothetical protein